MVFKILLGLYSILVCIIAPGHADEVSLLHEALENEEIITTKNIEDNSHNVHTSPLNSKILDFIEEENAQLRKIKLLDLDVTRAQLQLKQKEIQVKLAALNPVSDRTQHLHETPQAVEALGIIAQGVIYIDHQYQAIVQVNNNVVTVTSGDLLPGGFTVMDINAKQVVLKDAQDVETIILIGG